MNQNLWGITQTLIEKYSIIASEFTFERESLS
jgi:hypothetical protein